MNETVIEGEILENKWFIAAIRGNLDDLKQFAENNVDKRDENGCTALMYCANLGHIDCVKYLVDNGYELCICDKNGNTALMYAAISDQIDIVKILAKHESGIRNKENKTAYNLAIEHNNLQCAEFLKSFEGNTDASAEGKNLKKDLYKLEKAKKEMDKILAMQKQRKSDIQIS